MKEMVVKLFLSGDANRMNTMLTQSERRLKSFGGCARHEFEKIKSTAQSLQGKLAGLGMGIGAVMLIKQSAQLDQALTRIGLTADMSRHNVVGLRKELFRMSRETGQSVEELQKGFDTAVQAGLNFKAAVPVIDAVNTAMAVTGASGEALTKSLSVAASIFDFDLSKPGQALLLLDKMRVAGKKGHYEMEQLASIFPVVGFTAKRAGMDFEQTLGFVEALSQAEPNVERGGTLAKSWLRLFTNQPYMLKAQKSTGVKFFDDKGSRRNAMAVFTDIKKQYDGLKTDAKKHSFISSFLEGADTETVTSSVALLGKGYLENAKEFTEETRKGAGMLKKELPDAINNAVNQTGRLKTALREAVDDFIIPFNKGISAGIKKLMDSKKEGGLEMSGKEIATYTGVAALAAGATYHMAGAPLKKFLGKLGGTGLGIAEGKVIEHATGVTPVFVVNMPSNGLLPGGDKIGGASGKVPNALKVLGPSALAAAGTTALTVGGAVLSLTTAVKSLADVMRGGSGKNWIHDAWVRQGIALERDVFNPIASMFSNPKDELPMIYNDDYKQAAGQNNFIFNFKIDQFGRIIADNPPGNNVQINLNRGDFNADSK